jgi:hypothetical protein
MQADRALHRQPCAAPDCDSHGVARRQRRWLRHGRILEHTIDFRYQRRNAAPKPRALLQIRGGHTWWKDPR